jgi:hypothetical protein
MILSLRSVSGSVTFLAYLWLLSSFLSPNCFGSPSVLLLMRITSDPQFYLLPRDTQRKEGAFSLIDCADPALDPLPYLLLRDRYPIAREYLFIFLFTRILLRIRNFTTTQGYQAARVPFFSVHSLFKDLLLRIRIPTPTQGYQVAMVLPFLITYNGSFTGSTTLLTTQGYPEARAHFICVLLPFWSYTGSAVTYLLLRDTK